MRTRSAGRYTSTSYPRFAIPLKGIGGGGSKVKLFVPAAVPAQDKAINIVEAREDDKGVSVNHLEGKTPALKPLHVERSKEEPAKPHKRPLPVTPAELNQLERWETPELLPLVEKHAKRRKKGKIDRTGYFTIV